MRKQPRRPHQTTAQIFGTAHTSDAFDRRLNATARDAARGPLHAIPMNQRLHGSQPGEQLRPDDLVFIRTGADASREIIVRDVEDLHYELWFRHAEGNPAGYSLQYAGRRYEFARCLTEQEVLDLP